MQALANVLIQLTKMLKTQEKFMNLITLKTAFIVLLSTVEVRITKLILLGTLSVLLFTSCQYKAIFAPKSVLNLSEKAQIIKANTARLNLFMGLRAKEVIRLCNLARCHPETMRKYVKVRYGEVYAERGGIKSLKMTKNQRRSPYLKPSSLLWASAKIHAIISGLTAYEGHRGLFPRLIVSGNLNCLLPGIRYGENCYYGVYRPIELVIGWLESPGHRQNILNKDYFRLGVAGSLHFSKYHYNMVQNFSGPKVRDLIFRPHIVFSKN